MSRVSVAEHTKLSVFLARGLLRKLAGRLVVHPLLYWQLPGNSVEFSTFVNTCLW